MYEASLRCSPTPSYIPNIPTTTAAAARRILPQKKGIVDSGATHFYIAPSAPHGHPNTSTSQISVVTATEHVERSSVIATLPIPQLAEDFPTTGYMMPSSANTLVGVGPICDAY